MFAHHSFSRFMKMQLSHYLSGEQLNTDSISSHINQLIDFDPSTLSNDSAKKAFWINIYNGLTIYFIINYEVKESVREIAGFFTNLRVQFGPFQLSLDDIEHGILRKNGLRRNNKPLQFDEIDEKRKLMVNELDPRIHFALNCGGLSCPPIVFYTEQEIDQQLDVAASSFTESEFIIDSESKKITCSSIFSWYRADFGNTYLQDPKYNEYKVELNPYNWTLQ